MISTKTGQDGIASFLWGSWIVQTAAVAAAADGVEVGTMMFPCLGLSGGMTIVLLESSGGHFGALHLVQRHTTISQDHSLSFLSGEAWQVALGSRYGSQRTGCRQDDLASNYVVRGQYFCADSFWSGSQSSRRIRRSGMTGTSWNLGRM